MAKVQIVVQILQNEVAEVIVNHLCYSIQVLHLQVLVAISYLILLL